MFMGMTGITSDSYRDAGMLNGVVWIVEFGPDGPDLRALRMLKHRLEPIAIDHLDIVIHEHHMGALGILHAKIDNLRKVKRDVQPGKTNVVGF